ncbi:APG6-domain-containing protein [Meredithblackwellia eburnea MCA 4105]
MSSYTNCQKCRQPLLFISNNNNHNATTTAGTTSGSGQLASDLSPSTYDLISSSTISNYNPTTAPTSNNNTSNLASTTQRTIYNHASSTTPTPPRLAGVRVQSPFTRLPPYQQFQQQQQHHVSAISNPSGQHHHHNQTPAESFILLTDSVVNPARLNSPSPAPSTPSTTNTNTNTSFPTSNSISADTSSRPTPLTHHLSTLHNIYSILSSTNPTLDHPLCTECMDQVLAMMGKELEELRRERERLTGFEREVGKRRDESGGVPEKEVISKEIAKLQRALHSSLSNLQTLLATKEDLQASSKALDEEEAQLAKEEEEFWSDHSKYLVQLAEERDRNRLLEGRVKWELDEMRRVGASNVYNDAFCIGHEQGFATINKLRLGRLPSAPVEWAEINAAWGHTLLLLQTIARKFDFTFETYRLIPMGSFSKVEKVGGDRAVYELYGSGEINAVTRMLQNRRFDHAMVAFLDCLRQMLDFVKSRDKTFRVVHAVNKDKIGDVSIKYQFGTDEAWTRACRHVLFDLKTLLARASL